jgi:hypothetical protein
MTVAGLLVAAAVLVILMLWATRDLGKQRSGRCPDCGIDRSKKYPHKPRCVYWRDRP